VLIGTSSAGKVKNNRVLGVSSVKNRLLGFGIFSSIRSLVRNSSGSRATARRGGVGIALGDSRDARIIHSTFRGNSDHGIFVASASDSLIERNLFSGTATGIFLLDSADVQVRGNRVNRSGEAILVDGGSRDLIARNRVARIRGRGKGGEGIIAEAGRSHVIARNLVVDAHGNGIRLGLGEPPRGPSNTVVRGNQVKRSGKDGFVVEGKSQHILLRGNLAENNGDDGFDVESRTTTLAGNSAVGNADLGIEAVRGVIDGGRNRASGNGDGRQCVNMRCH
jgi:parallel beta-helix repeat protein